MNLKPRKTLVGAFALLTALSSPLVFAQSDTSATATGDTTQSATDPSAQSADTQAQPTQPTTSNDASAAAADSSSKKSWADVDTDKDGKLSKTEAASVPALGQLFDQADSDADGALTADEYKAYVAKSGEAGKPEEGKKE